MFALIPQYNTISSHKLRFSTITLKGLGNYAWSVFHIFTFSPLLKIIGRIKNTKGQLTMPGGQHAVPLTDPEEIELWEKIASHAGEVFTTSGRGKIPGKPFTYEIKGAEMFVSSRSKSITRSTVLYAYHKVKGKKINGPKAIGVHGDSYIYAVFKAIDVI